MRFLLFIAIFSIGACSAAKKTTDSSLQTVVIKTSAQCGMCKTTIESAFKDVSGVELAELDVTTKKLKVKFDSKKISLDEIRQRVANAGYDADNVTANQSAYDNLPACCKKEGGH